MYRHQSELSPRLRTRLEILAGKFPSAIAEGRLNWIVSSGHGAAISFYRRFLDSLCWETVI
jgi:hypothetical protein